METLLYFLHAMSSRSTTSIGLNCSPLSQVFSFPSLLNSSLAPGGPVLTRLHSIVLPSEVLFKEVHGTTGAIASPPCKFQHLIYPWCARNPTAPDQLHSKELTGVTGGYQSSSLVQVGLVYYTRTCSVHFYMTPYRVPFIL